MFLDGEAWRALLPAWMMAAMRAGEGERSLRLLGAVLAVLDPHFTAKTPEIFLERTAGLTEAQRVAISDFVSWASQHPMLKDDPRSKPEVARLRVAWPQNHPAPALKS
jgi:hypothetical protein